MNFGLLQRSLGLRRSLMELPPLVRRLLLGTIDLLLIPLAIWLSFWLRTAYPFSQHLAASFGCSLLCGLLVFPSTLSPANTAGSPVTSAVTPSMRWPSATLS